MSVSSTENNALSTLALTSTAICFGDFQFCGLSQVPLMGIETKSR
jgi:hypothetical protein